MVYMAHYRDNWRSRLSRHNPPISSQKALICNKRCTVMRVVLFLQFTHEQDSRQDIWEGGGRAAAYVCRYARADGFHYCLYAARGWRNRYCGEERGRTT